MADVQWIKIYIDMFDKRKIKKLRRLPAGNELLLIWIMLLATAGKCNAGGMIYITENVPFTEEDLADELGFEVNTIRLALKAFAELDMIATSDSGYISVIGWEEYQNEDKLAEIREKDRERKRLKRAQAKALLDKSTDVHGKSTEVPHIEVDKEKELEKDLFTTTTTTAPTMTEVYVYFKSMGVDDAPKEAEKFHAYNANKGWSCLPDWKATADLWIARIEEKGRA